ncbi:MAG: preprotein translocase subunit SecG [bacterium]|nr:preprotein translocase subunit SecG [bacterium]
MNNILNISIIVISVFLIVSIILQQRGTALGSAFGGGSESYSSARGAQKFLLYLTIILAIVFVALAVLNLTQF